MTPTAFCYLFVGIVSFIWPLAIVLLRHRVIGAQWLMTAALIFMGLSMVVYSTFFNSFLSGEYLLVILFMVFALTTLPLTQMSVTSLTYPKGVPYRARLLVLPSLVMVLLMVTSVALSGADIYRLWIERGADGIGGRFFSGSWRYDLIVAVHFYLFWFTIVGETLFVAAYSIVQLFRFRRMLGEYYGANQLYRANIRGTCLAVAVNCICIALSLLLFPFNSPRPLWAVLLTCIVESVVIFLMGMYVYRIYFGAEDLQQKQQQSAGRSRHNLASLSREVAHIVEGEREFLNPDVSVFQVAEKLHVSQDEVVDAVHRMHGTSFRQYVDSLRIEHAMELLSAPDCRYDSPEEMERVAHQCGYLDGATFRHSFNKVAQMTVEQWCSRG